MSGLDRVRARPGMYVGDVESDGLDNLLWELVGNAIDQHLLRRVSELRVDIERR